MTAPTPRISSLSSANNFGALRLLAALMVVWGHGQELKGAPPAILWNLPLARSGLDIFFCVSGYLIYDSWLHDPAPLRFMAKRALRILPALVVCVLFCVFVVGAAATNLPLTAYFAHHGTWQFLLNIALYLKLYLPGVFTRRLDGGAVNGSLWSLFPEVLCYACVPLLALAPGRSRLAAFLGFGAACGFGGLWMFAYHPVGYSLIYSADPKYVLVQVPFFMAGAFWRELQRSTPGVLRLDFALPALALDFILPPLLGMQSIPFEWLTFSYVVLAFGTARTPLLGLATRWGDVSYGTYLYAFPVQQLVLDHTKGFAVTLCTLITLGLALVSWHLVERPALRLKPGRRFRARSTPYQGERELCSMVTPQPKPSASWSDT